MEKEKAERLRAAGWKVADATDFLDLSPEELEYIEFKLALASRVKDLRQSKGLTQEQVARALGSSQSRIAKLESADASVSADLMLRTYFLLGARTKDIPGFGAPGKRRHRESA